MINMKVRIRLQVLYLGTGDGTLICFFFFFQKNEAFHIPDFSDRNLYEYKRNIWDTRYHSTAYAAMRLLSAIWQKTHLFSGEKDWKESLSQLKALSWRKGVKPVYTNQRPRTHGPLSLFSSENAANQGHIPPHSSLENSSENLASTRENTYTYWSWG